MKTKLKLTLLSVLLLLGMNTYSQDTNFWIFLCFGQSNMEGFPGVQPEDKGPVDPRFQVLAAVNSPNQGREQGKWSTAVPPLCRLQPSAQHQGGRGFGCGRRLQN